MWGLIFFLYAKMSASRASLIYSIVFGLLGWLCRVWRHHALGKLYDCNTALGQVDQYSSGSSMASCALSEYSLRMSNFFAIMAFIGCAGFAVAWVYFIKNPKGKISMDELVD